MLRTRLLRLGRSEDVDHVEYPAASKQNITFRFVAGNTAIKGGTFRLESQAGWTTPAHCGRDDNDSTGRDDRTMYADASVLRDEAATATAIDKAKISYGRTVTITVDALPQGGIIDVVYSDALSRLTRIP